MALLNEKNLAGEAGTAQGIFINGTPSADIKGHALGSISSPSISTATTHSGVF